MLYSIRFRDHQYGTTRINDKILYTIIRPLVGRCAVRSFFWAEVQGILWLPYNNLSPPICPFMVHMYETGMLEPGCLPIVAQKKLGFWKSSAAAKALRNINWAVNDPTVQEELLTIAMETGSPVEGAFWQLTSFANS
jgi:hypothetical protein